MNPVKGSSWAFERFKHHTTYLLYKLRAQSSLRIQKQNFIVTLAFWVLVQRIFYYCQREVIQKLEWGTFEVLLDRQENGGPCMSSRVWLFVTRVLYPARLLCPWGFPGKNTGLCLSCPPPGLFLTQGMNPGLLHWQADPLPLHHLGSPKNSNNSGP